MFGTEAVQSHRPRPGTRLRGLKNSTEEHAPMQIVVLGAGFGGLEVTTLLADALGDEIDVVLIDRTDGFVLGFSKLDVMFGRTEAESVHHAYRDIVKPGVRFVQASVQSIDPATRHVVTDAGSFDADVLVVALGAELDPGATPGLVEGGYDFYTEASAFALREVLEQFAGGRVVVGVTSTPFKCPPAPSETALMVHDYLTRRGLRDLSEISLVMPLPVPIPPSPQASQALLAAFAERNITFHGNQAVRGLDPEHKTVILADGATLPYDLFLGVPVHRAPAVVADCALCVDGWIPVDPHTLETGFPGVYAVGDVTSVGTPKAGVFAEGQGAVVADQIIAGIRGDREPRTYDGRGICYLEFGDDLVARVDVMFRSGEKPAGQFDAPSAAYTDDKADFGTTRIRRWFGRDWTAH